MFHSTFSNFHWYLFFSRNLYIFSLLLFLFLIMVDRSSNQLCILTVYCHKLASPNPFQAYLDRFCFQKKLGVKENKIWRTIKLWIATDSREQRGGRRRRGALLCLNTNTRTFCYVMFCSVFNKNVICYPFIFLCNKSERGFFYSF